MTDPAEQTHDANQSPVTDSTEVPVPRLGTPASETTDESIEAEADAVADQPDVGGLTPTDDAQ